MNDEKYIIHLEEKMLAQSGIEEIHPRLLPIDDLSELVLSHFTTTPEELKRMYPPRIEYCEFNVDETIVLIKTGSERSDKCTLSLRDTQTGRLLKNKENGEWLIKTMPSLLNRPRFTPDGKHIVASYKPGGGEQFLVLLDLNLDELDKIPYDGRHFGIRPKSNQILIDSNQNSVVIVENNVIKNTSIRRRRRRKGEYSFDSEGRYVASLTPLPSSFRKEIIIEDLQDFKTRPVYIDVSTSRRDRLQQILLSPKGDEVLIHYEKKIMFLDSKTGKEVRPTLFLESERSMWDKFSCVNYNKEGTFIVVGVYKPRGYAEVDDDNMREETGRGGDIFILNLDPLALEKKEIFLSNINDDNTTGNQYLYGVHKGEVTSVHFKSSGEILSSGAEGRIYLTPNNYSLKKQKVYRDEAENWLQGIPLHLLESAGEYLDPSFNTVAQKTHYNQYKKDCEDFLCRKKFKTFHERKYEEKFAEIDDEGERIHFKECVKVVFPTEKEKREKELPCELNQTIFEQFNDEN